MNSGLTHLGNGQLITNLATSADHLMEAAMRRKRRRNGRKSVKRTGEAMKLN